MKITLSFTHPQAIVGVYDFLISDKYNQSYFKYVLALPSFIMAVNGGVEILKSNDVGRAVPEYSIIRIFVRWVGIW